MPPDDDLYGPWEELTGIPRTVAWSIVSSADKTEVIEHAGLFLSLFRKQITHAGKPTEVLVVTSQPPGQPVALQLAIRVQAAPIPTPDISPMDLLRRIVDRFGFEVRLGATVKKLFVAESVSLPTLQDGPQVNNNGRSYTGPALGMLEKGPMKYHAGLYFMIDVDHYRAYLQALDAK
jgi:hypothetical protein